MGVFGDDPKKDAKARRRAYNERKRAEGGTVHTIMDKTAEALITAQVANAKRHSVMPLSTLPYVVTAFTVKRTPSAQYTWVLKADHSTLGRVYMTGLVTSVLEAVKAMSYCVLKDDWRLDKF